MAKRRKKSNAAPAGLIAGATGAAGAIVGYALRRRKRGRDAEPPAVDTPARETVNGTAVMPDMSSDPLVDEQTNAAAAQAGAIGGDVDRIVAEEHSGDSEESFEAGVEEAGR